MILLLPVWLQPGDVLAWTSIHTPSNHENLNRACIYYNVIIIWITASDWREREREGERGGVTIFPDSSTGICSCLLAGRSQTASNVI